MKNLPNKLLFLFLCCFISGTVNLIASYLLDRNFFGSNFYFALFFGGGYWLIVLLSGKLEHWSFRKQKAKKDVTVEV
jgi:ABC-type sugar transport system permease subunit